MRRCCAFGVRSNDEDGMVVLLQENPPPELYASVREAARLCPVVVIRIEEES